MSTMVSGKSTVNVTVGRRRHELRDREARQAGRRSGSRSLRRHDGPRDRPGADGGARRRGLLPAHGGRRGTDVRGREDPRRLLQARGAPDREGDPHRAHDRPPDPAALAEGLHERGAGHLHDAVGRPHHPARHPRDQRGLRGPHDLAAPVQGAGGRRADRPDRRPARHQPEPPRGRGGVDDGPHRRRHEGRPDDGRGRRRGGARGIAPRGARARARARSRSSARRRKSSGARSASRSGSTPRSTPRSRATPTASASASPRTASGRLPRPSRRSRPSWPRRSRWTPPRRTSSARCRCARASTCCSRSFASRPPSSPVREQYGDELRALTEAEQDSKQLKSAKRHLLFDRIIEERPAPVPGRPGHRRGRGPHGQGRPHEAVREEGRRVDLQAARPREDRGREAASGRARHGGDPADRVRGGSLPAHARLGALHPRPDADHDAAHARHRQGGAADRRSLPRVRAPLHAPLQLPALLGRGDGLHARPEAPRHRPRRACAAGARADDPASSTSSRTRSGSSPRRSSRTARPRWARSAARRSR